MKRTKIEGGGLAMKLAVAVKDATPGDVIEVETWHGAQLGHRAALRMRGEDHGIVFEVDGKPVPYSDADDPPEEP